VHRRRQYLRSGRKEKDSVVHCLKPRRWPRRNGVTALGPYRDQDRGGGSRGTPTLDGDKLFVLTENGDLGCLNAKDGSKVWSKEHPQGVQRIESPLVDQRVAAGGWELPDRHSGGQGAGMVKLEKATGKTVWACKDLNEDAGYSSCIAAGHPRCANVTCR